MIRILKDEESRAPAVLKSDNGTVYTKLLTDREYGVFVINDTDNEVSVPLYTFDFGMVYSSELKCDMYDVFTNEKHPVFTDAARIKLPAKGSKLFIMKLV